MATELQKAEDRLRLDVDRLAGVIGPRHPGKPYTMEAAAGFIEQQLQQVGLRVMREAYPADGLPVSNLIVEWRGISQPQQILIVGAHYDSTPETPGADDNASAVAVLLEMARRFAHARFGRTVRFVFFPCEEMPYFHQQQMGSQVYARGCRDRQEQLVGMLCLEMLGYFTTAPASQQLPPGIPKWLHWLFPKQGNFLAAVANPHSWWLLMKFRIGFKRGARFPLFTIPLPEKIREIRLSDHSNFWDLGYSALMLTDTSFLRNPHYHQPTDTPETLDYARMAQLVPGLCSAVQYLARGR